MVDVVVRRPVPEDVDKLLADIREDDRQELEAMVGDCRFAIEYSIRKSIHLWAFEADGKLACILGVATPSMLSSRGFPWMIGTTEIDRNVGAFIRYSKPYYDAVKRSYPYMVNYVDARNRKSIRWLKWLGFQFEDEPQLMGIAQVPFYKFELRS